MIFRREKEFINLVVEYLEQVDGCLRATSDTIQAYLGDDISKAQSLAGHVNTAESRADVVRHKIWDRLYGGVHLPLVREDISHVVHKMDGVANAAEKCCDVFLGQRPEIPDQLISEFLYVAQASFSTMTPLKEGMLEYFNHQNGFQIVWHKAKQVSVIESKVDKLEWDLTREIFASAIDYPRKIHLRLCLDAIVAVSDRAEAAAHQMERVAMRSVR